MENIEDMSTVEKRESFETNVKNYINQINRDIYEKEKLRYNSYIEK